MFAKVPNKAIDAQTITNSSKKGGDDIEMRRIIFAVYTLIGIGNIVGETWAYYLVYGSIEIGITVTICLYALRWPKLRLAGRISKNA